MAVFRPPMRYHGGKWRMAPWIISHFPLHQIYIEPFGGGGSVLLRKPRSYAEIYNDLAGEIVNLFKVLRDPSGSAELQRLVGLTPYARQEFEESSSPADDPVEQARRTLFRTAAGFSGAAFGKYGTGFRSNVTRSYTTPAGDWCGMADVIAAVTDRLMGVVIEHMDGQELIAKYDHPDALFYLDPPYLYETRNARNAGNVYLEEMDDSQHAALLGQIVALQGQVVLSGYDSEMYHDALPGWSVYRHESRTDAKSPRTEVLWCSPGRAGHQMNLFNQDTP